VSATAQREGCVFLDAAGEVLYAGRTSTRAVMQGMEVQSRMAPDRLHAITDTRRPTSSPCRGCSGSASIDASRIATVFMLNDWITHLLTTGRAGAEHSNASESMLYDVTERRWSSEILDTFDIPSAILPTLCDAGAPLVA
jgi:autoinducer 2 (AI-2) kinase